MGHWQVKKKKKSVYKLGKKEKKTDQFSYTFSDSGMLKDEKKFELFEVCFCKDVISFYKTNCFRVLGMEYWPRISACIFNLCLLTT